MQPRSTTATKYDIWSYRDPSWANLNGFDVEALDGSLGKIADESSQTARSYIVVDTGPWIFGRKVVLPAGTIKSVEVSAKYFTATPSIVSMWCAHTLIDSDANRSSDSDRKRAIPRTC